MPNLTQILRNVPIWSITSQKLTIKSETQEASGATHPSWLSQKSLNIIWVGLWDLFPNSPTGTFRSLHSFIFLMWLEQLDFFLWSALKTLMIPQRVGGTGKRKGNNRGDCWTASPGSEVRVGVKRWIVLGRDGRGQEIAESCAWQNISLGKMLLTHFFLLAHADYRENISGFCLFSQHIVWRRVIRAGNSFETEAKIKTSQGGLISVFLNVYMWIIYLSSGRKWGTITSLGKKGRKTNRWYLVPSFGFLLSLRLLLFSEAVSRVRQWTDGKGQWQEEDRISK